MRALRCIWVVGVGIALSGCAGYKLGTTNGLAPGEKSVQIVPFANKTLEPRLGDALTGALRKQVQRDGTYKLATHDAGDIVVTGTVITYDRSVQSLAPNDVITVRDYRLGLTAHVTARDRATGKVLFDKSLTGYTYLRVSGDLTAGDREALPLLATEVAKQATSLLADGSW